MSTGEYVQIDSFNLDAPDSQGVTNLVLEDADSAGPFFEALGRRNHDFCGTAWCIERRNSCTIRGHHASQWH